MSVFRFDEMAPKERYKLLCGAVTPRPIAWITSLGEGGQVNAAPYSFFNVFSEEPALVIIGMDRRADGSDKDTLANIERTGAFTVNIANGVLVDAMVATAATFPPHRSEVDAVGLETAPGMTTDVPRLAAAPVSLECTTFEVRRLSDWRHLVMGEVRALIARDGLFDEATLRIDFPAYDPVARLYGASYARLSAPYDKPVPDWRAVAGLTEEAE